MSGPSLDEGFVRLARKYVENGLSNTYEAAALRNFHETAEPLLIHKMIEFYTGFFISYSKKDRTDSVRDAMLRCHRIIGCMVSYAPYANREKTKDSRRQAVVSMV